MRGTAGLSGQQHPLSTAEHNPPGVPLPWQQAPWQQLLAAAAREALPHALLLTGPACCGSDLFAEALAAWLLCASPQADGACGRCKACGLLAAGAHGDLLSLGPGGKAESIQIAQVREAIVFGTQTPSLGKCKVLLISPAERMNSNAANALLKLLEEPAPNTFLLLVSSAPSRLPATVRSRCQLLRLPAPDPARGVAWLCERGAGERDAERALALTRGQPLAAAALLDAGTLEQAAARHGALAAALAGRTARMSLEAAVVDLPLPALLEFLLAGVQDHLRTLEGPALRSEQARQLLHYLEELQGALRALAAGANPQQELLRQTLLARLHGILGGLPADATLPRVFSPAATK